MKNSLGECSLNITRQNGEYSEILVSNPVFTYRYQISPFLAKLQRSIFILSLFLNDENRIKFN